MFLNVIYWAIDGFFIGIVIFTIVYAIKNHDEIGYRIKERRRLRKLRKQSNHNFYQRKLILYVGQTYMEVIRILGEPDLKEVQGDSLICKWFTPKNRKITFVDKIAMAIE